MEIEKNKEEEIENIEKEIDKQSRNFLAVIFASIIVIPLIAIVSRMEVVISGIIIIGAFLFYMRKRYNKKIQLIK